MSTWHNRNQTGSNRPLLRPTKPARQPALNALPAPAPEDNFLVDTVRNGKVVPPPMRVPPPVRKPPPVWGDEESNWFNQEDADAWDEDEDEAYHADFPEDYTNFPAPLEPNPFALCPVYASPAAADAAPSGCIHYGGTDDFDEEDYQPEEPPKPLELANDAFYSTEEYGEDESDPWVEEIIAPSAIGAPSQKIWRRRSEIDRREREERSRREREERRRQSEIDRREREEPFAAAKPKRFALERKRQFEIDRMDHEVLALPDSSTTPANSAQLPDKLSIHVSGRGSKKEQKVNLPPVDPFESKVAKLQCPHGCRLQLKTAEQGRSFVEIHVRSLANKGVPHKISLHGFETKDSFCPECSKHMAISLSTFKETKSKGKRGNAFMACLWAPAGDDRETKHTKLQRHITDALVLGFCLRQECKTESRILLVTPDVMDMVEVALLKLYWEVRTVQHLKVHPSRLDSQKVEARFSSVFTKLRCWEQVDFTKICVLDLDMVLTRGIDEIFSNQTPAALFRGNAKCESEVRAASTLYNKRTGEQQGGINAGCMIIEPSLEEFSHMAGLLSNPGKPTTAPEQDFLSIYFGEKWKKLHVTYNFQPHQMRFVAERGLQGTERQNISEVAVWHFSGDVTPRDYLFRKAFVSQARGSQQLPLVSNPKCAKATNIDEFAKALAVKWGNNKVPEEEVKNMIGAVMLWYETFEKMWQQLIVTTVGSGQYCFACDDEDSTIEHTFFYCSKTRTFFNTWKSDPRYKTEGLSGVSTLMDNRELYPASLAFVANVFQMRHPEGTEVDDSRTKEGTRRQALGPKKQGDRDSHAQEDSRGNGRRGGRKRGQQDNRGNDRRGGEGKGGKGKGKGGSAKGKAGGKAAEEDRGGKPKLLRPTISPSESRRRAEEEAKVREDVDLRKKVAELTEFMERSKQQTAVEQRTAIGYAKPRPPSYPPPRVPFRPEYTCDYGSSVKRRRYG